MDKDRRTKRDLLIPELYFLIQKFLGASPLTETYKVLCKELQTQKVLPARYDWEGNIHERTFDELDKLYPHISSNHLLEICSRIGPILDKEIPPCIKGVNSLLGTGRQSLLRTADVANNPRTIEYYATRRHGMPICDPYSNKYIHNTVHIISGREIAGPVPRSLSFPPTRYSQLQLQVQSLGHLSAVYCLLFDRTGKYIVTGADDLLIKLWSATSGRLLASFRGSSAEITDIDINIENTLLAAGSIDRILRVWDMQTGAQLAVLTSHTGMITSVHFCPTANWDLRYIATTSSDGSVAFWTYTMDARNRAQFVSKPVLYQEKMRPGQSQMICSAFSPGGTFLAAGSADHNVRVYLMRGDEGPVRVMETEVHTDRVDSIVWAHRGLKFVSGSKDGTALIWHFERQQWKSLKLSMDTKIVNGSTSGEQPEEPKKLHVTMVAWDYSDTYIITAVSDHCLKVWRSTGELERVLTGHTDGIYVLESHPKDPYVVLSTGHDGQLFIWDVHRGLQVAHFTNNLDNDQGVGAVFDAKWSPDGSMFAASDSHGHIMIYGFGSGNPLLKLLPKELFFHTDYRPLVRDADHSVLDEQTQVPPHLMPPPFLVDIDGNPYPPMLQRLVPGREHCTSEQLVPNIVIGNGGRQEVIQGLAEQEPRSEIDRMIAALAQRRYGNEEGGDVPVASSAATSPRSSRSGPRSRIGDVEGVRQSTGDWQCDPNIVWSKRVLLRPLNRTELSIAKDIVETVASFEMFDYQREIKKRPLMINTASTANAADKSRARRRRNGNVNIRRTRRNNHVEDDEPDQDGEAEESNNSSSNFEESSASEKEDELSLSDSTSDSDESSGYSDWVADQGVNLEPPKRSRRKSAHNKRMIVDGDDDEDENRLTVLSSSSKPKAKRIPKIKNGEIPEMYKALEWLSSTVPRKAPYCPQMGDEVAYFVQGHQMYAEAVKSKKPYNINNRDLPWTKRQLKDLEFVKIVGIKYIIKPPRLCCLKLAMLDEEHKLTEDVFTIKYHDMADVLDFLVLKQTYETAISRSWTIGDRFRCMIDDGWWMGKIISKSAVNEDHPESVFMCYEIQWDNGESERMSPWDLEPIDENRIPETVGEAVPVLPEEIQNILYQPTVEEWPRGDRDAACRRILSGLDKVMTLAIAEPFLAPVDLNLYPTYALIVEYPIDLSTVKARFENHFYRRITSAQFDVRYLATNAEQFNEPHSVIVKSARIITELCLRIIKNCSEEIDVQAVYHQLMDTYETSCSDEDGEPEVIRPGPSTSTNTRHLQSRNLRSNNSGDWRIDAKRLLDDFFKMDDSAPFRVPVDRIKHPEYYQIIDTPMDLSTVREDLFGGNYETPHDFAKDMKLIFSNSKNFNTNKRSKIYAMTIRLSAKFEEQIKGIISNWKRSKTARTNATPRKSNRRAATVSKTNRNGANAVEDSDNSEKENRYRKLRANRTKRDAPSTSKVPDLLTTDEEDDDDVDVEGSASHDRIHANRTKENAASAVTTANNVRVCNATKADEESSDPNDDIPLNELNTRMKSQVAAESDDSDYEPLSKYTSNSSSAQQSQQHRKRKKVSSTSGSSSSSDSNSNASESSESSSSNSDSGIKKNLRPRNKRSKMQICSDSDDDDDSDSDNLPLKQYGRSSRHNGDGAEESEPEENLVSVSSRGRVRKLTERARALWKK